MHNIVLGPIIGGSSGFSLIKNLFDRFTPPVSGLVNSRGEPLSSTASGSAQVETTPEQQSRKIITARDLTPRNPTGDFLLQDYRMDADGNLLLTIVDKDQETQHLILKPEHLKTFQRRGRLRLRSVAPEGIDGIRGKIISTLREPVETWIAFISVAGALTAVGAILLAFITGFPIPGPLSEFFLSVGAYAFQVSWISGVTYLVATGVRRALELKWCTDFTATTDAGADAITFEGCIPVKYANEISECVDAKGANVV